MHPRVRIEIPWNVSIGDEAAVGDSAILYALGPIFIGDRATVSQYAHLCAGTHDLEDRSRPLVKSPIYISNDSWIAADAFIGPGVTVGAGAVIGACSVVVKDVVEQAVVAGNPAQKIGELT